MKEEMMAPEINEAAFSLPWKNCCRQSKKLHGTAKDNKC